MQDRLNGIVSLAVNPERSVFAKHWNSIGSPLLKGILATSENYGSAISMGFRIVGTLQGIYALQVIVDNVYAEVAKRLKRIDEDTLMVNLILENYVKVDKEQARVISQELQSLNVDISHIVAALDDGANFREASDIKAKVNEYRKTNEKVGQFLSDFMTSFVKMEATYEQSMSMIIKMVSDKITDQIVRIIDSQLVSPWTTYAVSGLTDQLSKRAQHYCLVDKEQNTDKDNADQEKYVDIAGYSVLHVTQLVILYHYLFNGGSVNNMDVARNTRKTR